MGLDGAESLLHRRLYHRYGLGDLDGDGHSGGLSYPDGEYRPGGEQGPDGLRIERIV
ncbi:MAG: hypothetical protein MSA11_14330 [Parabacteroides distasonis]|nr:hypothetical protein [uncultured Parabacteroides sp.]MCI7074734.1 hypothetical protein [Parabacteroides distasonis]